jgi:Peptidase C39 family
MVAQPSIYTLNLPWDEAPLRMLEDEQKLQFRQQAQVSRHTTGEVLWSSQTLGSQLLVLSGNVRLVQEKGTSALEPGKSILLKAGDWIGDALNLVGKWKARATSKEVVVAFWRSDLWQKADSPALHDFWADLRWRYQPLDPQLRHPASGYPYVFHLNSAAACLTMVTQQLQIPIPLKQVLRQVQGQTAQAIGAGAETIGLQLHHIQQVSWMGLDRLSFPALLHWRQEHWIVVYEVNGDRMVIADPLNRHQQCESVPREIIEAVWDGQLWLVQPAPKAESFNLRWFIPAVWQYHRLLGEVLLASLVLQVLGLASPLLTPVVIDKVLVHESLSTLHLMNKLKIS